MRRSFGEDVRVEQPLLKAGNSQLSLRNDGTEIFRIEKQGWVTTAPSATSRRQPRRRRRSGQTRRGGRRRQRWLRRRRGRRQRRRVRSAHVGNRPTARFAGQAFCTVEDATAAVTDDAAVLNHRPLADQRGAPVVRHAANTWYAAGAADHAARTRSTIERASTSIANAFAIRCADRLARHVLAGSRIADSAATVGKPGAAAGKAGHPA